MKTPTGRARTVIGSGATLVVLAALLAAAAAAQVSDFELSEVIDVRVVNVDVIVTDSEGVPIAGLGPEDFELLVNGQPVEIDYFTSIRDGSPLPRGADRTETRELEYKPYLVLLFDGRSLDTIGAREALETLKLRAESLTDSTRGVMVARHGRVLRLDQGFTRQPELLRYAIDELAEEKTRAVDSQGSTFLLRRLESAPRAAINPNPDDPRGDLEIEAQAIHFLAEVRSEAQLARTQTANAIRDLARFVRSLAGLPGRKCVLYLSPGFNVRPGEVLFHMWWNKYWPIAREVGVASIETEIVKYYLEEDLVRLVREAAENNITFYTFDPGGLRVLGFDTALASRLAGELVAAETDWSRRTLLSLASGTGGIGRVDSNEIALMIDGLTGDLRTYYSLGFEPAPDAPDRGRIQVRVRHPGYRVRHLENFAARGPKRLLEERTLAALLTDEGANPLDLGVEIESAVKQKDGSWVMPVLIKVPLARVTLLPRETTHVGRLQVVIIAQSASGDLSDPAHAEVPIEIENADLLAAMNTLAGYRMRVRMRKGEQRLAIGVRDEITGEESTVNLVVDAGGATR